MKKLLYTLTLLTLLLLPVQPAFALGPALEGRVVIGTSFTLKSGETLTGDLVIIGGQAVIEQGAVVQGDSVVIGGNLQLDGQVDGNAVVIGGLVSLGDQASLAGDAVTIGGTVWRAPGARIGGNIVSNFPPPTLEFPGGNATTAQPLPPQPRFNFDFGLLGRLAWNFFLAVVLGIVAVLLTVFLHPQLDRVARAVAAQPVITGSIGVLTVIVAPLAALLLAVTIILSPLAFALAFIVALAWLFGIVALGLEVGDRFSKAIHRTWEPALTAGLGTFLLSLAVMTVSLVPCIGWLAPAVLGMMGLGAVVVTVFGTRLAPSLAAPVADSAVDIAAHLPPTS